MLDETADIPLVEPYPVIRANPEPALIQEMVQRLGAAKNPIILAGSGTEYSGARQELIAFSEKFQVPVVTYRRLAAFPTSTPTTWGTEQRPQPRAMRWPERT
jgi:acetolactate synthase-1/2/3 large subunit